MNKWIIRTPDADAVASLTKKSDLTKLTAEVLVSRGYDTIEKAGEFLADNELSSPFLMRDMKEAADCINSAVEDGKVICIFGDYDCDGITSTVMLYSYLSCLGADVCYYIPERSEGYGMNESAVRKLADDGIELIITVDNGISAIKEAELIAELGMELIITDHHRPSDVLPKALAIVDPYRSDCTSPFKNLCGAGVALKLIAALDGGDYDAALEQFSDLAAIGTIGDIVKLTGENRTIVETGIRYLANTENYGLSALIEQVKLNPERITSTDLAFRLIPKINATGRIGSPKTAVELLLSEDYDEAMGLAEELIALNDKRKASEVEIVKQIDEYIRQNPLILNERALIFAGEGWHHGVIGLVSTRLTERYGKPSFVISIEDGEGRGSARSVGDFSIFDALTYCKELFTKFGGHTGAGGFSLDAENIPMFREMLKQFSHEKYPVMPRATLTAEKVLTKEDISVEAIRGLDVLEPFGEGNPSPSFALLGATVIDISPLKEGKHTRFTLNYLGMQLYINLYGVGPENAPFSKGDKADFIVSLQINEFGGNVKPDLRLIDCRKSGVFQAKYFNAKDAYERYILGEGVDSALKARVVPTRDELAKIYTSIPENEKKTDRLFFEVMSDDINYFKLKIAIDAFEELGLIKNDRCHDTVSRLPAVKKVNLNNSEVLQKIKAL